MIEILNLSKKFNLKGEKKKIHALNNVNFSIREGDIFGLLGPNGAGKTTLIHILTTIKQPTSGYATIDGINILKNPKETRAKVALMLDNQMLYFRITGYDNLKFFCKIYNVSNYKKKIHNMAEEFGLEKWLNQYVEHFSSGMKMKLALCRTLLLEREVLFLDEPTLGLDVKIISFIIDKIKKANKTIFLTSHDMNVVEKLCDRVAFIDEGKIIRVGNKDDIKKMMQNEIKIDVTINGSKNQLKSELNQEPFVIDIFNANNSLIITLKNRDSYQDLLQVLGKYPVQKVKEQELSLEDLFLKII